MWPPHFPHHWREHWHLLASILTHGKEKLIPTVHPVHWPILRPSLQSKNISCVQGVLESQTPRGSSREGRVEKGQFSKGIGNMHWAYALKEYNPHSSIFYSSPSMALYFPYFWNQFLCKACFRSILFYFILQKVSHLSPKCDRKKVDLVPKLLLKWTRCLKYLMSTTI